MQMRGIYRVDLFLYYVPIHFQLQRFSCCIDLSAFSVLHDTQKFYKPCSLTSILWGTTVALIWTYVSMQGPLSSSFPIENRNIPLTLRALKNHLDRTRSLSFVKRISDFHLLLLLARFLDLSSDVPALAECVQRQSAVPEGYQLLIESLASS